MSSYDLGDVVPQPQGPRAGILRQMFGRAGDDPVDYNARPSWTDRELAEHMGLVEQHLIDLLDSRIRQVAGQRSEAWAIIEEGADTFGAGAATTLQVQPATGNLFVVEFVYAYLGAAAAGSMGLVELGQKRIPFTAGVPLAISGKWKLENTDQRLVSSVTITNNAPGPRGSGTAGYLALYLFGRDVAARQDVL